jgi:hypothetical protein
LPSDAPTTGLPSPSLWWLHERLHRAVIRSYIARRAAVWATLCAAQDRILGPAAPATECQRGGDAAASSVALAARVYGECEALARAVPVDAAAVSWLGRRAWAAWNARAGFVCPEAAAEGGRATRRGALLTALATVAVAAVLQLKAPR